MEQNLFINQLKQKNTQALESLVREYKDKVFHVCTGYLQNTHDAADVTQEVFIKVLEKIDQYKGNSKISTWIIRIAINLSLNHLRDNKKRLMQEEISDTYCTSYSNDSFQTKEIRKVLRRAIYSLPDKQKKVFILNYYLDLSYKEISDLTDFSISSIESLLFRARRKLRELLNDVYEQNIN